MTRAVVIAAVLTLHLASAVKAGAPCGLPLDTCIAEKTQSYQRRGVLGIFWSEVEPGAKLPVRARYQVGALVPGSPAERAGLKAGDLLLSWDGKDLSALTQRAFESLFESLPAGQAAKLRVLRQGKILDIRLVPGRPTPSVIDAWIAFHVQEHHGPADNRELLRRLRSAGGRAGPRR